MNYLLEMVFSGCVAVLSFPIGCFMIATGYAVKATNYAVIAADNIILLWADIATLFWKIVTKGKKDE